VRPHPPRPPRPFLLFIRSSLTHHYLLGIQQRQ
jgi:hypothetical protein